jgi:hypothetical protein
MSKLTLAALASGYRSSNRLNENFETIEDAFQNTISRDGTSPNYMEADFDMNGYRILNSPAPISPTHLVRLQDLQNYVIGGDVSFSFDAIPNILDYRETFGADPTGDNDSTAALLQFAADCSDYRVQGLLTPGRWIFDSEDPMWFGPGAGLWAFPHGADMKYAGLDYGLTNATILRPWNADGRHEDTPNCSMHSGSSLTNVSFYYPDVVSRLLAGEYELDCIDYPTIVGAPEVYAPCIISDHVHSDTGLAGNKNCGGVELNNISIVGGYDGVYFGDATVSEEPWATRFSSGLGLGIAGCQINGYRGCVLNRNLIIERSGNLALFNNFAFAEGFWIDAGQMKAGDAPGITTDKPLIQWQQKNNHCIEAKRKFVGGKFFNIYPRNGSCIFHFDGATGPGPDGQDIGKFAHITLKGGGVERYPTLVKCTETAYMYSNDFQIGGHFMDFYDDANVQAVVEIETDADMAGTFDKQWLKDHPGDYDGAWKPMSLYQGWFNTFRVRTQESAGPILRTTAADGHSHYIFDGESLHRWCQGDTDLAAFEIGNANTYLHHTNAHVSVGTGGSELGYNHPDPDDHLLLMSNRYFGVDPDAVVIGSPDFLFNSCALYADGEDFPDDEGGEDGPSTPEDE